MIISFPLLVYSLFWTIIITHTRVDTILLLVVYLMFSSAEDRNRNCCPRVLLNFAVAARSSRLNLRDKESSWFSDDVPWRNEGHNSRTSMGYPSFCSIGWKPQDDHQLHRNLAAPRTKQIMPIRTEKNGSHFLQDDKTVRGHWRESPYLRRKLLGYRALQ